MRIFETSGNGKQLVIHLSKGDLILESLEEVIHQYGIQNGVVVSGIGSVSRVCYHRIKTLEDLPTNEYLTIDGPIEMASLQGLIIHGEPHLHISCCGIDQAFAGHLEHGSAVQYLAEICIQELPNAAFIRRADEFGISYIDALQDSQA